MRALRPLSTGLFVLGAVALLAGAVLAAGARLLPAEGFGDLGRLAGALLLAAIQGAAMGGSLLAARLAGEPYPPPWRILVAAAGAFLSLVAIGALARLGGVMLAFALVAALLAVAGLAATLGMVRATRARRVGASSTPGQLSAEDFEDRRDPPPP